MVCKVPHPTESSDPTQNIVTPPTPEGLPLANPIADLAANIPDLAPVGLAISGAPATVANVVSTPAAPIENLHTDNTVPFTVRYTCPVVPKPQAYAIGLHAHAGVRLLTSANASLACGPSKPPAPPAPEIITGVAAVAAPAAAPPNPPVQGSGNGNPNPALNANAGFAQQEDEERQLAFADADHGAEFGLEDDTAQMSARRVADDPSQLFVPGALGLMMTAGAAAIALRQRRRTQLARCGTWR
jgi:hypothetical protein